MTASDERSPSGGQPQRVTWANLRDYAGKERQVEAVRLWTIILEVLRTRGGTVRVGRRLKDWRTVSLLDEGLRCEPLPADLFDARGDVITKAVSDCSSGTAELFTDWLAQRVRPLR